MLKEKVPIFHKVSNMLKISIFVSKMRKKPVIPKLIFLKKSRKLKRFLLLKNYNNYSHNYNNYGFLDKDYEFSPSSTTTPLFRCHKKIQFKKYSSHYRDAIYSFFFISKCFKGEEVALPLDTDDPAVLPAAAASAIIPSEEYFQPLDLWNEEESVDLRADKFIERFYQNMRMQRQESI